MFDPVKPEFILSLEDKDLLSLPKAEDERHEYKSSRTSDNDLAEKIARAASAFWNSGGGLFVAGVDGSGVPDGGVSSSVGRQARRDWVDRIVSRVSPLGRYWVQSVEDRGAGLNIVAGKAVLLIAFGNSEAGPHMAPDNRYYIRAGTHTDPAGHFLVEAIHARRGLRAPLLSHFVRYNLFAKVGVLQLGIVCLNEAPALDVELSFIPPPRWLERSGVSLRVPMISHQFPFLMDFHMMINADRCHPFQVTVRYQDLAGRQHEQQLDVDVDRQMGPTIAGPESREIVLAIERIANALQTKRCS